MDAYERNVNNYHLLMSRRVKDILLISNLYDACIINEDCRLAERIAREYRGLNLSRPPRVTWAASADEAFSLLDKNDFDMVITMYRLAGIDAFGLGRKIKARWPNLPVLMLTHNPVPPLYCVPEMGRIPGIDHIFNWSGDADLSMSMIKCVEDLQNVRLDTERAGIRVILLAESSQGQLATVLPVLYREIMTQNEAALEEGLDEEDRLIIRQTRPKVVIADHYEAALKLYQSYKPYLMGVLGSATLGQECRPEARMGLTLLKDVRDEAPDLPFLFMANDPEDAATAESFDAVTVNISEANLKTTLVDFGREYLGFGDFIFRDQDRKEIRRVRSFHQMTAAIEEMPEDILRQVARSPMLPRWLYARGEIVLADHLHKRFVAKEAASSGRVRQILTETLQVRRIARQKRIVTDFDPQTDEVLRGFQKIGHGSMGGKARGLVFLASQINPEAELVQRFPDMRIYIPDTLVLTTDIFEDYVDSNRLDIYSRTTMTDEEIATQFLQGRLPEKVEDDLRAFTRQADFPLAIRSSSLLEDSQTRPYAGIYKTYMLPNNQDDPEKRLQALIRAVKLVFASTFFEEPRAFAARTLQKPDEEKMAVIIQRLVGRHYGDHFYPAISGVAQSYNYYPMAPMKPEDGMASIAVGLGKTVVDGERALRFCPAYPQHLPQFSIIDDMLENAQRDYYGLKVNASMEDLAIDEESALEKRDILDIEDPELKRMVFSTYMPDEQRIKDTFMSGGHPVVTFASILKYGALPLPEILAAVMKMGQGGMDCAVDVEFSINLPKDAGAKPELAILQIRPMASKGDTAPVDILPEEAKRCFCYSENALGNGVNRDLTDIIYVKPADFDAAKTVDIAREIGRLNAELVKAGRKYILIGPGRWGSADPWLGIPVRWADISGVAVIVETTHESFTADPSQGSHFFHNMTSLGMSYFNITGQDRDFIKSGWFNSRPVMRVTRFLSHIHLNRPVVVKVDGRCSTGVIRDSR
jgi:DNA-binding NarL/FixJ family response regulator